MRFVTLLWHELEPVGICVFTSPAIALGPRGRFFGLSGTWSRTKLRAWNQQLVTLSRVVLHPTYRGAGMAAEFVRRSCELCPWPWIETLAEMGHINPFFERAGFVRVSAVESKPGDIRGHSAIYGTQRDRHGQKKLVSAETHHKSRFARPVYYIFDNRPRAGRTLAAQVGQSSGAGTGDGTIRESTTGYDTTGTGTISESTT